MIDRIEIYLPGYIGILSQENAIINNKNISINEEDIENIIRIIRSWNKNYIAKYLDKNTYRIRLYSDNKMLSEYYFNNLFPDDFDDLIRVIGDIYDR